MTKKVIFAVAPNIEGRRPERSFGCSFTNYPMPNLGLLTVAALLDKEGYAVEIIDDPDYTWDVFYDKLFEQQADYYIFHTPILATNIDVGVAKKLLEKVPSTHIIFFGPHPTYVPSKFLFDERVVVARGEVDYVIRDLVAGKSTEEVKGISYLKEGKLIENETVGIIKDIDQLPIPARWLDKHTYANPKMSGQKYTNVLTTRGCAYQCYYCVPNSVSWARELEWKRFNKGKPPVTKRSPEAVLEEVKNLVAQGYKEFSFIDDQFVWEKERTLKMLNGLKELHITYGILARADRLTDEDIVKALAESGCQYIDIGVESFDQEVLNYIKKGMRVESIYKAIELLNKYHITPKVNIMFGTSPNETKESIIRTIKETKVLPIDYCMFSIATPFPGTEFEKHCEEKGWLTEDAKDENIYENLNPAKRSLIKHQYLTPEDLERLTKQANREFYLRPSVIVKQIRKTKTIKGFKEGAKTLLKLIK